MIDLLTRCTVELVYGESSTKVFEDVWGEQPPYFCFGFRDPKESVCSFKKCRYATICDVVKNRMLVGDTISLSIFNLLSHRFITEAKNTQDEKGTKKFLENEVYGMFHQVLKGCKFEDFNNKKDNLTNRRFSTFLNEDVQEKLLNLINRDVVVHTDEGIKQVFDIVYEGGLDFIDDSKRGSFFLLERVRRYVQETVRKQYDTDEETDALYALRNMGFDLFDINLNDSIYAEPKGVFAKIPISFYQLDGNVKIYNLCLQINDIKLIETANGISLATYPKDLLDVKSFSQAFVSDSLKPPKIVEDLEDYKKMIFEVIKLDTTRIKKQESKNDGERTMDREIEETESTETEFL